MQQLTTWLAALPAGVPTALLALLIFGVIFAVRKLAPGLWAVLLQWVPSLGFDETPALELVHKFVQSIPALVMAAVLSALGSGGNVKQAVVLALAGPLAVLGHELLKWLPFVPYLGALGQRKVPPMLMLMLCFMLAVPLVLFCSACGLFAPGKPLAPVAGCAPSASSLLDEVGVILLSGGDYEAALAKLAADEGRAVVDCAVRALLAEWMKPAARTDTAHQAATARGHLYLQRKANP